MSINYNDRASVESAIAEHEAAIKQHYAEIDRIRQEHWEAAKNSSGRIYIESEPVHGWFSLSYAHYLTIPRSVMQAMPWLWQRRIVELMEELDDAIDWRPDVGQCYMVGLYQFQERWDEDKERFVEDSYLIPDRFQDYRHPVKMPFKNQEIKQWKD